MNPQLTVEYRVKKLLIEHLGASPEKVVSDANLSCDLNADSLDHVELLMALEEEFDIQITDDHAEHNCITVGEVVRGVEQLVSAKA